MDVRIIELERSKRVLSDQSATNSYVAIKLNVTTVMVISLAKHLKVETIYKPKA